MDISSRSGFLNLAGLIEGGTVLAALGLAALVGIEPWERLHWRLDAVLIGLVGTFPMFTVYFAARKTRSVAVDLMGQSLSLCTWYDLILLAALAGLGEELLFRGVLQQWMSGVSPLFGFLGVNLLFGLVHAVTPVYALLATGIGMYLSWLTYGLGEPNLLPAMVAHGVYDYVAFLLIVREYRTKNTDESDPLTDEPDLSTENDDGTAG